MANKKVIITRTVQFPTKEGSKTLNPSDEPQTIDAELAKEGLKRGWAKELPKPKKAPAKKAADPTDPADDADQGNQTDPDGDGPDSGDPVE